MSHRTVRAEFGVTPAYAQVLSASGGFRCGDLAYLSGRRYSELELLREADSYKYYCEA